MRFSVFGRYLRAEVDADRYSLDDPCFRCKRRLFSKRAKSAAGWRQLGGHLGRSLFRWCRAEGDLASHCFDGVFNDALTILLSRGKGKPV